MHPWRQWQPGRCNSGGNGGGSNRGNEGGSNGSSNGGGTSQPGQQQPKKMLESKKISKCPDAPKNC
jgi:hypothetical protein